MSGAIPNRKHELFAQGLAKGLTQLAAYRAAGYEGDVTAACRLAKDVKVQARVAELIAKGAERAEITVERVLRELARIGFSDVRRIVKWTGNQPVMDEAAAEATGEVEISAANFIRLMDSDELDADTAACISQVSQTKDGNVTVKLYDKPQALLAIGRHLEMFTDKVKHGGTVTHVHESPEEARANIARYLERERQRQAGDTRH